MGNSHLQISRTKIRQARSQGECLLALHLKAHGIRFEEQYRPAECPRRWLWDFYLPDFRVLIEVNGSIWVKGAHSFGKGLIRDYQKSNWAALHNFIQLSYATQQVQTGEAIEEISRWIASPAI